MQVLEKIIQAQTNQSENNNEIWQTFWRWIKSEN